MTTGKRQFPHLVEVGAAAVEPPIPPTHLKASGKRIWKRLWEAGQARPGPLDEPAVIVVCEHADQIADLRRMVTMVKRPETESKYQYAIQAAEKAIANPLLDEISLRGAKGVLINITGGHDLTLFELDEAANRIREEVDPDANIIVGSTLDTELGGVMRVSVVATGIDAVDVNTEMPVPRRSMSQPLPAKAPEVEQAPAAEAPAPVAAQAEYEEEPQQQLFKEEAAVNHSGFSDTSYEDEASDADDLPPPAYRPEVASFQPRREEVNVDAQEQEAFVAPRAPAPGTPSPEALARLRAAAQKASPSQQQQRQPQAQPQQQRQQPAAEQGEKRFGINSLINRMTGHGEAETQQQRPARQQPPVQTRATSAAPQPRDVQDEDQERIEIPAFLRRQAN